MRESARDLLERIEDGFARFEIEFGTRRKVLADRYQMFRLSQHYHEVRARFIRRYGREPVKAETATVADAIQPGEWHSLQYDAGGQVACNATNCDQFLRYHPMLSGIVGTDLSTGKITLKAPLPLDFWETFNFDMRPLTKGDVTSIHQFLQHLGLQTIERADVEAAVQRIARENAWRPQD